MQNYLTKSKYLSGLQCHKRLWYEKNHPERKPPRSRAENRKFRQDKEVGERARARFPEGKLISATSPLESAEQTQTAIRNGASCIFEASFIFENTWVRCDILQRDGDSWNLIEVKMSTSVKEEHLPDLAIQKHVLTVCGISISETRLMHVNNRCTYPNLSDLFIIEDVTDRVDSLMSSLPSDIETFTAILDTDNEPNIPIGEQCDNPYPCPFKGYCWQGISEENLGGQPEIDTEAIRALLSNLECPIHFFDFETDNPPVPKFEGLRPYRHLPFQYSCHKWHSDGTVTHHEYLHTDTSDPRLPLVESLLDTISDEGSVVVYYASFENQRLKELAEFLPQYASPLRSIQARLWDQLVIFRNHYTHPEFRGSNSLKSVAPVIVPSLGYNQLDIQDGREAQAVWSLLLDSKSETERANMIRDLKAYCKLDTWAMVEIHEALLRHVNE